MTLPEIQAAVDQTIGVAAEGWTEKWLTMPGHGEVRLTIKYADSSPRRFVVLSKDSFKTADYLSFYEIDTAARPERSPWCHSAIRSLLSAVGVHK